MRATLPGLIAAVFFTAVLARGTAHAQVTLNPGALDLLPAKPAPAKPPPRPAHPAPLHSGPAHREPTAAAASKPATPAPGGPKAGTPASGAPTAATAKPALPTMAPAVAALPPPAAVPPPRPQPVPVVPVSADATGTATPEPGGLRITFGKDSGELNPATEAALRALADKLKPSDTVTINIYAFAASVPDDPSTPRRLALARALAARAVLITQGIPSTRIYPRALGPTGGETDPDRVDVVAGPPGPAASTAPPVQQPGAQPGAQPPPAPGPTTK